MAESQYDITDAAERGRLVPDDAAGVHTNTVLAHELLVVSLTGRVFLIFPPSVRKPSVARGLQPIKTLPFRGLAAFP